MGQARGSLARLVLDLEATYRTQPAPAAGKVLAFNSCSVKGNAPLNSPATMTGTRNPVAPWEGNKDVSGDIVIPVDEQCIGWWLRVMFGAPTTTGTGDPYTHVFKVPTVQPSFLLERKFTDGDSFTTYLRALGCKVGRFSVSAGGDGEVTATVGIVGGSETNEAAAHDASPTTPTFLRLGNQHASVTAGGGACSVAKNVTINLDFGLDGDQYCIGSGGIRGDLPEGIIAVSGTMSAIFTATTFLTLALAGTEGAFALAFTNSTHSLTFAIDEMQYQRTAPGIEGPRGVMEELAFQGFYANDADASAVKVTLVNGVASYA